MGPLEELHDVFTWVYEHCIPLVREITFQNGEEMTEEGLPLLILFYHSEDPSVKEVFKQKVETELKEHRGGCALTVFIAIISDDPLPFGGVVG